MFVVGHFLLLDQLLWLRFDFGFDFSFDFIYSSISFTVSLALFFCCFICCGFCCFFYYFCHAFFVIFFLLLDGAFSLFLPCLRLVLILDEWNNFYWFQILTLFYTRSSPRVGACRWVCATVSVCAYCCLSIRIVPFVCVSRCPTKKIQNAAKAYRLRYALYTSALPFRWRPHLQTTKCGKYFTMTLLLNRHVHLYLWVSVALSAATAQTSVWHSVVNSARPIAIQHVC